MGCINFMIEKRMMEIEHIYTIQTYNPASDMTEDDEKDWIVEDYTQWKLNYFYFRVKYYPVRLVNSKNIFSTLFSSVIFLFFCFVYEHKNFDYFSVFIEKRK